MMLFAVLRFGLWRMARGGPGSSMLLGAAVLGLLGDSWVLTLLPAPGAVIRVLAYTNVSLGAVALLMLGLGLLRSHLVPAWIAALAIVASVLYSTQLVFTGVVLDAVGIVLQITFLVAIGISLLGASKSLRRTPGARLRKRVVGASADT
jgi:hypothetical protein